MVVLHLVEYTYTLTLHFSSWPIALCNSPKCTFFIIAESIAYEKMHSALTNEFLKKGVMQASPIEQTSCLEGYTGMFCRYWLLTIWIVNCCLPLKSKLSGTRQSKTYEDHVNFGMFRSQKVKQQLFLFAIRMLFNMAGRCLIL